MVSPFTAKQMRLVITSPIGNYTVGVVEMIDLQPLRESNVEHRYGLRGTQPDNRHKVGMKRARFTIRRWFKTDPNQGKVFYDLHDNDIEFTLKEYVKDSSGFVGLILNGCMSYDYRLITGTANDIVGEEISGEATSICEKYTLPVIRPYHTSKFGDQSVYGCILSIENAIEGEVFTITEDGDADSITILLGCATAWTGKVKCAIYKHSDLSLVGVTEENTIGVTTPTWYTFNFIGTKPSLVSGTAYILVAWAESASGNLYISANFVGGSTVGHIQGITYNGFPNPFSSTHVAYSYSIYCTYTAWD